MKRLFFFATAAIVALASCTKTKVVYTDAPEEIGFKAVTGVMTKADLGENTNASLGVYAELSSESYFENIAFALAEGATEWTGNPAQYWPAAAELTFTVYAPYDESKVTYKNSTLTISCDNTTSETDWLYGANQVVAGKNDGTVSVNLNHALAKVQFNFVASGDVAVVLKSVALNGTKQAGTCTVNYEQDTPTVQWDTESAQDVNVDFGVASDGVELSTTATSYSDLVVPVETQGASMTFTYTISGGTVLTHTVDSQTLGAWQHGKQYTYSVSIGATEIKFSTPTVNDFGNPDTALDGVEL